MDPESDQHRGSSSIFSGGFQGLFKNSSSPESLLLTADGICSLLDMHGDSIVEIIALHHPLVLRHTDLQRVINIGSCKGIEYTTPFTSIIPSLPFTLVRDFLRIFLEVKVACIPNGLHALLIFSLIRLMYGRSTLVFGRHSETHFLLCSSTTAHLG